MDLENRELRKGGTLIRLPPQPFQVLQLLAESPGEVCSRDQIRHAVWGSDTHVDFDRNLNVCMTQIRAALSDEADAPRFIQTVPRRGYRFVAPVERPGEVPGVEAVEPARNLRRVYGIAAAAAILLVGAAGWRLAAGWSSQTLLAALPFEEVSGGTGTPAFVDGLLEETIAAFGSSAPARLGVIARTSVKRFQGTRTGAQEIGAELGAQYLVEGALRWDGARVRVTARLIDARSQAKIADYTLETDASNAFSAQQQIAAGLAAAFIGRLFPGSAAPAATRSHALEASQAYAEGRKDQHLHTRDSLARSVGEFQKAVEADPGFTEAWSALAEAQVSLGRSTASPDSFEAARAAAGRALGLDERSAAAHNALANVLFWRDWNWNEAERHFRRAIELNPSLAAAHHDYAFLQVSLGRTRESLAGLRRALALDPLSPRVNVDSGWLLLQAHRFDEAEKHAQRSLELDPATPEAFSCLVRTALSGRDYPAALRYLNKTLAQPIQSADAEAALRSYYSGRVGSLRSAYLAAAFRSFLGEREAALGLLERAFASHEASLVFLKTEPLLEPLHGDPRYEALVRQMHLP